MADGIVHHISETGGIARFIPRQTLASEHRASGKVVWAVGREALPNYLLARDCPRVTYRCSPVTTQADKTYFFGPSTASRVIAIDQQWFQRATQSTIWIYDLSGATFECIDLDAGHYVSHVEIVPVAIRHIADPIAEMLQHDVELRFVRDLAGLQDEVAKSSLSFSSTRLRNLAT